MSFLKKIGKNIYFQQTVYALLTAGVLVFLISILLNVFTRHGASQPVPDFKGMPMDSVRLVAKQHSLRLEVIDSVYRVDFPRGMVFEQNPRAGIPVKKNRKIFLTINSMSPKKESVPNVVGSSLRQAKADLNARGFYIGQLDYVSDIATNNVLAQRYKGVTVEPGILLPVGTEIDLKLGLDALSNRIPIPNVVGMSYKSAKDMLAENSLNCVPRFDKGIKTLLDSLNASVYRQDPPASNAEVVSYGSKVNIFLKLKKADSPK